MWFKLVHALRTVYTQPFFSLFFVTCQNIPLDFHYYYLIIRNSILVDFKRFTLVHAQRNELNARDHRIFGFCHFQAASVQQVDANANANADAVC